MTSKGVSSQCDCEDANSVNGAWNCLLLLAWHSISSSWVYVLGFAVGATHYSTPCTCPHLTTQSLLMVFPPRFHPCINTISPVKKGRTTCSLPLLFLIDYAEQPSLHPSLPTSSNCTGVGSMPGEPPPSFLFPPSDLIVCPPTYTSPSSTSARAILALSH